MKILFILFILVSFLFITSLILISKWCNKRKWYVDILVRKESCWIGLHYSPKLNRYCLNYFPCVTITWSSISYNEQFNKT